MIATIMKVSFLCATANFVKGLPNIYLMKNDDIDVVVDVFEEIELVCKLLSSR